MIKKQAGNIYEQAFENWLIDNHIQYFPAEQLRETSSRTRSLKSFDFLVCPDNGKKILAEVKGRKFTGTTLEGLKGLQNWVTRNDVESFTKWHELFGSEYDAVFVFAYYISNVDVDCDGRELFEFAEQSYLFLLISLEDYRSCMKPRSSSWDTVCLSADDFRRCTRDITDLFV